MGSAFFSPDTFFPPLDMLFSVLLAAPLFQILFKLDVLLIPSSRLVIIIFNKNGSSLDPCVTSCSLNIFVCHDVTAYSNAIAHQSMRKLPYQSGQNGFLFK